MRHGRGHEALAEKVKTGRDGHGASRVMKSSIPPCVHSGSGPRIHLFVAAGQGAIRALGALRGTALVALGPAGGAGVLRLPVDGDSFRVVDARDLFRAGGACRRRLHGRHPRAPREQAAQAEGTDDPERFHVRNSLRRKILELRGNVLGLRCPKEPTRLRGVTAFIALNVFWRGESSTAVRPEKMRTGLNFRGTRTR